MGSGSIQADISQYYYIINEISDMFAGNGFKVFLYDQRGLGASGGMRGSATIRQMHEDLEVVL
jgi:alpha-beta hydrolase superfamily lysophospholipase